MTTTMMVMYILVIATIIVTKDTTIRRIHMTTHRIVTTSMLSTMRHTIVIFMLTMKMFIIMARVSPSRRSRQRRLGS